MMERTAQSGDKYLFTLSCLAHDVPKVTFFLCVKSIVLYRSSNDRKCAIQFPSPYSIHAF